MGLNNKIFLLTFMVSVYFNLGAQTIGTWNNSGHLLFGDYTGPTELMRFANTGQLGIGGAPNAAAILDMTSTTMGVLIPRMTTAERDAIATPATGLLVYNSSTNDFQYYNGSAWVVVGATGLVDADADGWIANMDANDLDASIKFPSQINDLDNNTKIQLEESANEDIIRFDLAGTERWVMAGPRLEALNSGSSVFIGQSAGLNDDLSSNQNVFIGNSSGRSNTNGFYNVAMGVSSLRDNNSGAHNTALGYWAMYKNTTGIDNVAVGYVALQNNETGSSNFAGGAYALDQTTGSNNTAIGRDAGKTNTTGTNNTFLGRAADATSATLTNATAIGANAVVGASNALVLGNSASIGIGTSTPSAFLHVSGGDGKMMLENGDSGAELMMASLGTGSQNLNSAGTKGYRLWVYGDAYLAAPSLQGDYRMAYVNGTGHTPILNIDRSGKVGIGFGALGDEPQTTLDVNGQITMQSGAVNGYLPVSDANGTMTWTDPATITTGNDGDWTVSGTNLYSAVSGDVGIGVSTPSEKLEVTGNLLIRNPQNNGALIFSPSNSGYGVDPEFVIQSAETGAGNATSFHLSRNALYRTSDNSYQYIDDAGVAATKFEYTSGGDMKFSYAAAGTGAITWTDNVIIKGSTGDVGIGDASPDGKLEVRQTASADIFNLYDDATNVFTVLDGGNVGIGTTSPNAPLQFSNTFPEKKIVLYEGGNNDHQYYGFGMAPSELQYRTDQFDADHVFYSAINTSSSLELMRIQGDGKVGIGTATPAQQLSIGGINDQGWIYMDSDDEFIIENNQQSNRILLSDGTGGLRFEYSGSEIMRVNTNVGIGLTTPSEKLEVVGNVEIPAANDYKYATAKTQKLSITGNSFNTDANDAEWQYHIGGNNIRFNGASTTAQSAFASVQLPQDALITDITFWFIDEDSNYDMNFYFGRMESTSTTHVQLGDKDPTYINSVLGLRSNEIVFNPNPPDPIDNQYAYFLEVEGVPAANHRMYMCTITYQISKAQ